MYENITDPPPPPPRAFILQSGVYQRRKSYGRDGDIRVLTIVDYFDWLNPLYAN